MTRYSTPNTALYITNRREGRGVFLRVVPRRTADGFEPCLANEYAERGGSRAGFLKPRNSRGRLLVIR